MPGWSVYGYLNQEPRKFDVAASSEVDANEAVQRKRPDFERVVTERMHPEVEKMILPALTDVLEWVAQGPVWASLRKGE